MFSLGQIRAYLQVDQRRIPGNLQILAVVCFSALAAVLTVGFWEFNVDDSYIGYRIAENLAAGNGWVYNPGEKINGATSPLWTLVLTLGALGGFTIVLSHTLTAVCIFVTGYLTWRIAWQFLRPSLSLLAGVMVQSYPMLVMSISMETWLYLAFALASVWAWFSNKPVLLGACLSALVLSRPDGIVLAGILMASLWVDKRLRWATFTVFLVPLLAWSGFSLWEFGSPVPNTLAAKMAQARSGFWSLSLPPLSFLPLFFKGLLWWLKHLHGLPVLVLALPFGLAGLLSIRKWHPILSVVVLWGALHLFAYSALKVPHYHWYYGPVILAIILGSLAGCEWLFDEFGRRSRLLWVCIAAVGCFVIFRQVQFTYQFCSDLPEVRNAAYEQLGVWLRDHTDPAARVAAAEIGVIGYFSGRTMVDMAGLIHAEGPGELLNRNAGWWLPRRRPDVIIAHTPAWRLEAAVEQSPEYRPIYELNTGRYQTLRVFERVGSGAIRP